MSGPRALLRRLPHLAVAALGLWLWQGGGGIVPTERVVSFRLAPGGPLSRVDVQLYDAAGHLLAAQDRALRRAEPPPEISLTVQSRPTTLRARIFRWRSPGEPPEALQLDVPVSGTAQAVLVDVPAAAR